MGFAIYFIIWHSIPSILDQMKFIYGSFTLSNFIAHYRNAFAYWLASIIRIGLSISYLEMRRYLMLSFPFFCSYHISTRISNSENDA
jgi:hypothetical protein